MHHRMAYAPWSKQCLVWVTAIITNMIDPGNVVYIDIREGGRRPAPLLGLSSHATDGEDTVRGTLGSLSSQEVQPLSAHQSRHSIEFG